MARCEAGRWYAAAAERVSLDRQVPKACLVLLIKQERQGLLAQQDRLDQLDLRDQQGPAVAEVEAYREVLAYIMRSLCGREQPT